MKKKIWIIVACAAVLVAVILAVAISCGKKAAPSPAETAVTENTSGAGTADGNETTGTTAPSETAGTGEQASGQEAASPDVDGNTGETAEGQEPVVVGGGGEAEIIIPEDQSGEGF